ncbi:DUF3168 domain-containing protein [Roseibium litorale]|uniref:DUF3168 domain-containing protein n=1 Tax=Roseibium litorale TaxID=2803841 RepID=A0ABR9CRJ5_9HYPH|nr:DUF3168 domain-containing protein [Roseibium litorale]MBD8893496.1 DUF3168 domain-containing protein [Roseibium litorale]
MSVLSAELALRKALLTRLNGSTALTAQMGSEGICDVPARGQAFPFLSLETLGSKPLLSDPSEGLLHDLRLQVLSRAPSRDEVLTLMEEASGQILDGALTLDGHHLVGLQLSGRSTALMRDGRTFRGVIELRAVTEPVE